MTSAAIAAERLDRRAAVYRLRACDRRILYIGVSENPRLRVMAHSWDKSWWPQVTHVGVAWYPTRAAALIAEAILIQDERPLHNEVLPSPLRPRDGLIPVGSNPGFPHPVQVLAMGPVWAEADVTAFLAVPRAPGRRPKTSTREEQAMSETWVAYDTVTFDVIADGREWDVKKWASGNLQIACATEAGWRRAVKAQDRSRMMSANPPKRMSGSTIHL